MARPKRRTKAPSKSTTAKSQPYHNRHLQLVPMIMGLLIRGDTVSDIAAHCRVEPAFVAGIADGTVSFNCVRGPADMSEYPALPCSREADVDAALSLLGDALDALSYDDEEQAVEHLFALGKTLESYKEYWRL